MHDLKAIRFVEGTKISHDYQGKEIALFSYRELIEKRNPAIGIPCKQNGLIIIDIDVQGSSHKKDGREWWHKFSSESGIPDTYTVRTRSGGFHFYFKLPISINPEIFQPPATLADGVDIKWNGWVAAPPTEGYTVIHGNISTIATASPALMMEIHNRAQHKTSKKFEIDLVGSAPRLDVHRLYTASQIKDLTAKLEWAQTCVSLSYSEWRNGLFSMNEGIDDVELLHNLAYKWTYNQSYTAGDEAKAVDLLNRATRGGPIGPGTIFSILKDLAVRHGAPQSTSAFSKQEILDSSGIPLKMSNDGSIKVKASESNAAQIIGSMFGREELYHDIRQDLYIFKGKPISDTELTLTITPMLQSANHGLGLEDFKVSCIASGIDILLNARRVDPYIEWLNKIIWDKIPRIDTFWTNYVQVPDSAYTRAVGKNFWISIAARGLSPGIKFDSMVVIEGSEGIQKSSLVQAIGGDYTFTPSTTKLMEDLDDLRKMHQSTIVELPELMGLINQDSNKVKSFLSKPFDHIRSLYARKAMKKDRGFVFIGTTNNSKYLTVDMGVRRFWPIVIPKSVKKINLNSIQVDREQLFAEAVFRFKNGESFYEVPTTDQKNNVRNKVMHEPLLEPIRNILPALGTKFSVSEVYQRLEVAGYLPKGLNTQIAIRIENALKVIGVEESDNNIWIAKDVNDLSTFI